MQLKFAPVPIALAVGAALALSPAAMAVRDHLVSHRSAFPTAVVTRAEVESTVSAKGVLQAKEQMDVGTQVSGQLKSLKVKLGDRVQRGQLLAEIDPVMMQNALLSARTTLASLQAQEHAVEANLWRAKLNLQRQEQMLAREATSRQDLEAAKAQADVLQADLASFKAQIAQAGAQVQTARSNLAATRIIAPIDGEVVALLVPEGHGVTAGQQGGVILRLADVDHMTVHAQISEADVIRIRPGQAAWFTILGDAQARHSGALQEVEPAPQEFNGNVFYNAVFDAPNPGHQLRIGMTAQVTVVLDDAKNTLSAPMAALGPRMQDGRYAVRVLKQDGSTATVPVRVGINDRARIQVLDGLKEFDQVVTVARGG